MASKIIIPAEWQAHDDKVQPYLWRHRRLAIAKTVLGVVFAGWLIITQRAVNLEWSLNTYIQNPYLLWLAYFGVISLMWKILSWPIAYGHYRVERAFQLSKQSVGSWLADDAKATLLGIVFGAIALGIIYLCVEWSRENWWVLCCAMLISFSIVLAQLAPILLIPLFYKMKPMEPGPLKDRLLALCERFKIQVKDVYHLGLGQKTEKGNAAFMGLGRTKRIVIGDTLYEKFSADEVEAVFAHELGHQVNFDVWKGIVFGCLSMYLAFYLANWFSVVYAFKPFMTRIDRPFGLLLFFFVLSLVQIPLGWVQAGFSRWRERSADRFAAQKIGVSKPLASALERLTVQNFGQYRPSAWVEFFTHSHPAPWRRILKLR